MSLGLLAAAITLASVGAPDIHVPPHTGLQTFWTGVLDSPQPYPFGRVDSPSRAQNGRLWVSRYPIGSRTPIAEQVTGIPGTASYGAPYGESEDVIYVRIGNTPFAINPWEQLPGLGFERQELARNEWLKGQGYVLHVRTHTNAAFQGNARKAMYSELPTPRATIQINDEMPRRPSKLHVLGPATVLPGNDTKSAKAAE